ncbi:hypothetical protein NRS6096_22025 (plasmid) [Bacillus subtilis]|nr:hypothetical protein NRS6096_22025 [Bacillus subtilis]
MLVFPLPLVSSYSSIKETSQDGSKERLGAFVMAYLTRIKKDYPHLVAWVVDKITFHHYVKKTLLIDKKSN